MFSLARIFSFDPAGIAKTETKTHDDNSKAGTEFKKMLQGSKGSICSKPIKTPKGKSVSDKSPVQEEECDTLADEYEISQTQYIHGYNGVKYQLLAYPDEDTELQDIQIDETLQYTIEEYYNQGIVEDTSIALDDEVESEEVSSADQETSNAEFPNYHNNIGFEDSLRNGISSAVEMSISSLELGANVSVIHESDGKNFDLKAKPHIEEQDHITSDTQQQEEVHTKVSFEYGIAGRTDGTEEEQLLLSEVEIKDLNRIEETRSKQQISLSKVSDNDDELQLNSFGIMSSNLKDISLDFSKVLDKQDPAEQAQIIEKLADRTILAMNRDSSELEVLIRPEHLGKLVLKVTLEDGILLGKIYTINEQIKDFLQNNLEDLKTTLKDQGFVFTSIDVDVGSQSNPNTNGFNQLLNIRTKPPKAGISGHILRTDIERKNPTSSVGLSQIDYLA